METMDDYLGDGTNTDVANHMRMQKKLVAPIGDRVREEAKVMGEIATLENKLTKLREGDNHQTHSDKKPWEQYSTYAKGVHELKKEGRKPLSFKENWEERLDDKRLFETYQDTSTAILYGGGAKFKVDLDCEDLTGIPEEFNKPKMEVDYKSHKGIEFDRSEENLILNQELTKKEFLKHDVYKKTLGEDLMKRVAKEVYDTQGRDKALGIYLRSDNAKKGDLWALVLDYGNSNSYADGGYDLSGSAGFVRGSPK